MYYAALFWLGLMVLFIIMEAQTVALMSVWFAAGSLVAVIAALLGAPIWLQAVLFFAVAAILLASMRPLMRKYVRPKIVATNVDALIGTTGYVITDIDNLHSQGYVKLGTMEWVARSTDGSQISAGTLVRVERIEGAKAMVSVVENKMEVT